MSAPLRLTNAQRVALETLAAWHDATAAKVAEHLPPGHYRDATENRAEKLLARLEKRGLVWKKGAGRVATWHLTGEGQQTLG